MATVESEDSTVKEHPRNLIGVGSQLSAMSERWDGICNDTLSGSLPLDSTTGVGLVQGGGKDMGLTVRSKS